MKTTLQTLLMILLSIPLAAQLPTSAPTSHDQLIVDNRTIAEAFAPTLEQIYGEGDGWFQEGHDDIDDGHADRIVNVDYDGDFINTNNWDNAQDAMPLTTEAFPYAYYQVFWTTSHWIIVYTFYYARDHADHLTGCGKDEHEGDTGRVYVAVSRPTPDAPTAVGEIYRIQAGPDTVNPYPPGGFTFYSASGSHHFFDSAIEAWNDADGANPCKTTPLGSKIYTPATGGSAPTKVASLSGAESYGLIEIFEPGNLWDNRNYELLVKPNKLSTSPLVYGIDDDPSNDQFRSNNGLGSPASLPWNGDGWDPLSADKFQDYDFGDAYLFNQFMCNGFTLELSQTAIRNGEPVRIELINDILDNFKHHTGEVFDWSVSADFTGGWSNHSKEYIDLHVFSNYPDGAALPLHVSVTFETVDCGLLTISQEFVLIYNEANPSVVINSFGPCDNPKLSVVDAPTDATYEWSFAPLVDNSGLNNSTVTLYSGGLNFTMTYSYTVTITSVGGTYVLDGTFIVPACWEMGLIASPNPSSGIVHLEIINESENDDGRDDSTDEGGENRPQGDQAYRVRVMSAGFHVVHSEEVRSNTFTLDLSDQLPGAYYIIVLDEREQSCSTIVNITSR